MDYQNKENFAERRLYLLIGAVLMDLNWRLSEGLEIFVPKEDFSHMVWDLPVNCGIRFASMGDRYLNITRVT